MKRITIITLLIGIFVLTGLTACNDNDSAERADNRSVVVTNNNTATTNVNPVNTTAPVNAGNATVAEIMSNPNNYIGKNVVVSGWAERSFNANSFRLDEDSVFTGGIDNDLLVVGKSGVIPAGVNYGSADAKLQVSGTVKRMVIADVEREYGIDLTSEIEAEFKDKPVLMADSVRAVEE